jgi:hypothetical protein
MNDDSTGQRYVPAMASFVFDRFLRFDDLTTLLHDVAAEYGDRLVGHNCGAG